MTKTIKVKINEPEPTEEALATEGMTEAVKAMMDMAVRSARRRELCDQFDALAAEIFEVDASDVVDSEGFTCKGFDKDGFNTSGFNRQGLDRDGFNEHGFDTHGYDREGFDRVGLNREGVDRRGRGNYRFDSQGYDQDGFYRDGRRANAYHDWFVRQLAKPAEQFCYNRHGDRQRGTY